MAAAWPASPACCCPPQRRSPKRRAAWRWPRPDPAHRRRSRRRSLRALRERASAALSTRPRSCVRATAAASAAARARRSASPASTPAPPRRHPAAPSEARAAPPAPARAFRPDRLLSSWLRRSRLLHYRPRSHTAKQIRAAPHLLLRALCDRHRHRLRSVSHRLPARLRPRLTNLDPFEQHRQLMRVDRHTRRIARHFRRETKGPTFEPLVHDREAPARPHQKLHLIAPLVQEYKDVAAQRVPSEHRPNLVREPIERLAQVHCSRRKVHVHRARQEHHGLTNARANVATHSAGNAPASPSSSTPPGNRITGRATPITVTGINPSARPPPSPVPRSPRPALPTAAVGLRSPRSHGRIRTATSRSRATPSGRASPSCWSSAFRSHAGFAQFLEARPSRLRYRGYF